MQLGRAFRIVSICVSESIVEKQHEPLDFQAAVGYSKDLGDHDMEGVASGTRPRVNGRPSTAYLGAEETW